MEKLKIIFIIFAASLSAALATGQNFTLTDAGLMSLDWSGSSTSILLEKTDVMGPGVKFVIEYQGNQMQDQSFRHISHENHGAGSLTGIDVSIYDNYQLKFTLLSIDGDTNPDTSAVLGVGALIGPYDDHSSAYDPEGLDFAPDPEYGTSAISSTPVRLDNTPSLIGFVAYLPWLYQWSPLGTTVAILVEAAPGAAAIPKLPKTYYVDDDARGFNNGSSWDHAYNDLQDALVVAESSDEIRVAQGAYTPEGPLPDIRRASNPNPTDRATGVSRTAYLSWTAGSDATSHDVYFGTTSPGMFQGNQTATTFDPGMMAYGTTYYWRIDEVSNGAKTAGTIWSFITLSSPPPPPPLGNSNEQAAPAVIDRTATFQLKNGVVIKGGYAGFGQPDPNVRDIGVYETILSGDIGIPGDSSDNSIHVVTGSDCDSTAVLDGFKIIGGNANGVVGDYYNRCGAGMFNAGGSPTVINCTFTKNSAAQDGGGLYNRLNSSPTVTNCKFIGNSAKYGGGMYHRWDSNSTVTNCIFSGNFAEMYGGGIFNWCATSPTLRNCTFSDNTAPAGNALACNSNRQQYPSNVRIVNCILWDGGNEIVNVDNSVILVTYSDVQDGYYGTGNIIADPRFIEPGYFGPIAYWKLDETNGTITFDSAGSNHGSVYGAMWTEGLVDGALSFDGLNDYVSIPENSELNNLNAITLQAWIYPRRDAHWHVLDKGDGDKRIYAEGTTLTLDGRVRYTGNHASTRSVSHTLTLNNWQHVALTWSRGDNTTRLYHNGVETNYAIRTIGTGDVLDDRSHLWTIGARGALGEVTFFDGIIDEAAIYDRVLSPEEIQQNYLNGLYGLGYPDSVMPDCHLLFNSPCINTGDPDYMAALDETDLDGKPRVIGGRIDMGAYEFNHNPIADAGPEQTVEAQAPWGATVTLDGSGSSDADSTPGTIDDINDFIWYLLDPCDPNTDVLLGSGEFLDCNIPIGEHIILLEVIDRAGASDTDEVTIIVQDTTPPDINCPPDVILECPADTTPSATGKATATDTCGTVTIRLRNRFIPGCGNTETIERHWIATDESGNSSSCVQIITVVDTTPPVITCPADVTLECPADTTVETNGSATADDSCGSVTIAHSDQLQQGCGNTGVLTRTWKATDECGNSSSCVQMLTVVDKTPPDFELSVSPTILWPPDHKMVLITPTWTVSDKCDPEPQVSLVGIVMSEDDNAVGDGHTTGDIEIGEDGKIYVRSERSGANSGRIYTITYQAVDDCGNVTLRIATVSIPHDFKVLARIADRWLLSGREGSIHVDFNNDGIVNLEDFAKFAENWIR